MHRFTFGLIILCAFQTACKPIAQISDVNSILPENDFNRSQSIILNTKSYLPYSYTADGCYARSTYMSMELAAEGIPSSSLIVWGQLRFGPDMGGIPQEWGYHTAPMATTSIQPTIDNTFVFDPSLFEEKVTFRQWVERTQQFDKTPYDKKFFQMTITDGGASHKILSGANTDEDFRSTMPLVKSIDDLANVFSQYKMIDSYEKLSDFSEQWVLSNCNVMMNYLTRYDKDTSKPAKLLERTNYLLTKLKERNKYNGSIPINCIIPESHKTSSSANTIEPQSGNLGRTKVNLTQVANNCNLGYRRGGYSWIAAFGTADEVETEPAELCDRLPFFAQLSNMRAGGLQAPQNFQEIQCLHKQFSCTNYEDLNDYRVRFGVDNPSFKNSCNSFTNDQLTPKSCLDVSYFIQTGLMVLEDLKCWQAKLNCEKKLR